VTTFTTYDLALLVHLLGVLFFFGGNLLAGVAFEAARRRSRPSEVGLLLGLARVGVLVVGGGVVFVLGGGFWLADLTDQLGKKWLSSSLALFVAALVLGGIGGRRPKQARRLAARLAEERDEMTEELRMLLDDRLSALANYASTLLVLAILVLMVWRPQ
jgi:uncharacterized membrane protein